MAFRAAPVKTLSKLRAAKMHEEEDLRAAKMHEEEDWFTEDFPGFMAEEEETSAGDEVLFSKREIDLSCSSSPRGVLDRDAADSYTILSPLFLISNMGTEEEVLVVNVPRREAQETETGAPRLSPKRLLVSNKDLVVEAAKATFRMEGSVKAMQDVVSVPGTAFATSAISVASALHMRQDDGGRELDIWRVARGYPMTCDAFNFPIKRMQVDLLSKSYDFASCDDMLDPRSGLPYLKTRWEENHSKCDAGFWKEQKRHTFDAPRRPEMLHKFKDFWLPMSLKAEASCRPELDISNSPACAMVSYPVFSGLQRRLRSGDKSDQESLLKEYRSLFGNEIDKKVEDKAKECSLSPMEIKKDAAFRDFRKSMTVEIFSKIRNALSSTFAAFKDGDCVCSIGRVLDMNNTMVATSLSSLPGSSGAALFLLGLQVERMFFAVHNAPSVLQDDYNIATHTDNPSFVLVYFTYVIDDLPSPTDSYWEAHDLRYKLFVRWLHFHLALLNEQKATIVGQGQDWSKQQLGWLRAASDTSIRMRLPL